MSTITPTAHAETSSALHATTDALRRARARFIRAFPSRLDTLAVLARVRASTGHEVPALRQWAHRLGGLAGMVGFPGVSVRAAALEHLASAPPNHGRLQRAIAQLADAFAVESMRGQPEASADETISGLLALVAIGDQPSGAVADALSAAGADVQTCETADVPRVTAALQPDVVAIGIDAESTAALRTLRCDPTASTVPVVTVGAAPEAASHAAGGAMLTPDGHVSWPVSSLQLQHTVIRAVQLAGSHRVTGHRPILAFDALPSTAAEALRAEGNALGVVLVDPATAGLLADAIEDELGRADLLARLHEQALVVLSPDMTAAALAEVLHRCGQRVSVAPHPVQHVATVSMPPGAQALGPWVEAAVAALLP